MTKRPKAKTYRIALLQSGIAWLLSVIMCARAATAPSRSGFTIAQIRGIMGVCPPLPAAGPQRFACASAQHPGMIVKKARCKEAGLQIGLNEAHGGGLQQYVMACMQ